MEAKAIAKSISMSPRKVRLVVDQIRGRSVNEAYAILQYSKKAAADPVSKTLRSAVANAQYRAQEGGDVLDVDTLRQTRSMDRRTLRAAAQGRAMPIRKRTSHITVIVDTKE